MRSKGQFWAIPKEILEMGNLSLEARIVYGIFWTRQNGDNVAWPGQEYLARVIGCSVRSVRRYTGELTEAGLISAERQGSKRTNRYTIYPLPLSPGDKVTGQFGRSDRTAVSGVTGQRWPVHCKRTEKRRVKRGDGDIKSGDNRPTSIREILARRQTR